jgi:hypothetical protein
MAWPPGKNVSLVWTTVVLAAMAPFLVVLISIFWHTPYPISEAVGIFEDLANRPPSQFLVPETSYYRPLFHLSLSALWHNAGSLEATLDSIRLLHIVPVTLLLVLFTTHLRPRSALDAACALTAVAVLTGSLGFRDNLEIPLSYTIVGMPIALGVWMLVNAAPRAWHAPLIVVLTLVAVGFKEQGLVVVPVIVAAWWMRAPGATRGVAATVTAMAIGYVVLRLAWRGSWPMFEQSVGFGFSEMEPPEAAARFGGFPLPIYAYSSLSTVLNVLLSEPTRGVFRITQFIVGGYPEIWQLMYLFSSAALTALIAWWGVGSLRRARREGWSSDARLFVALVVALLACGALSFNYSRDRLGGMATVFYALAAFDALRTAAERALVARRAWFAAATFALVLLASAWHARAVASLEIARFFSERNQMEWLVRLPERRDRFATRQVYLDIMQAMRSQGTRPDAPRQTRYPRLVRRTLGLP